MKLEAINFNDKFSKFSEHWQPKIIAQMDNYHFKIVKFQGELVWHSHEESDEVFIVIDGAMTIMFRDGSVDLNAGELFVVPKGIEHIPVAEKECKALVIDPAGTFNTGNAGGDMTARNDVWI